MKASKTFVLALAAVAAAAACGPEAEPESTNDAVSVSNVHPENAGRKKFLTVMSRNLYLGADIFAPFGSEDPLGAAAEVFDQVLASDVSGRAHAVAGEIAATRPDVVGLQEVPRIVVTPFGATEPVLVLDFIEELMDGLAEAGFSYALAAVEEHTDITVPLPALGVQVRFVDRDAILADADVEVLSSGGGDFLARFETTLGGFIPVTQLRGWTEAQLRHEQVELTFVNTHLEVREFGPLQALQAGELLSHFDGATQLVLVGDMNSDPRDPPIPFTPAPGAPPLLLPSPYAILSAALVDAWSAAGDDPAFTCCFDADLTPPSRDLFERVDLVFATPSVKPMAAFRTGLEPLAVLADAAGTPRWPSDHAGVVSILRLDKIETPEPVAAR
jgi:endonuclease/exonuclease/phosphatase family metal-dependent hydrolase